MLRIENMGYVIKRVVNLMINIITDVWHIGSISWALRDEGIAKNTDRNRLYFHACFSHTQETPDILFCQITLLVAAQCVERSRGQSI